ncbi:MAG: spoIIIJ-associated protein [Parcubacteria group bacterium Athens0416_74]|nr:MAG: spoIIIJ-associated protein [Parcubacteria group bacterium Athens0416_74]
MAASYAVEDVLKEMLDTLGVSYSKIVKSDMAGQTIYSIETDDARRLIGMHGDTIQAIDMLVKKIVEKRAPLPAGEEAPMFLVDVNDYRTKQIRDIQTKALMMAERARSFQYDVELTPMSAYERLIVHTTLQDAPNVKTESQGEGRNRRVVIKYSAE